ncbi:uncharacterized protein MELLADRAFT_94200 [Melampsora larici-populina 98AG31]|uniref:Uncharacterized protein n=1 Tax=Melampsora larici-populina (strain 98AG31 / pathotype 3-4-7) TaxID=747676 RepID=F4S6U7_MELLP|nr:uncharacterized protein MELLADRAFT_94200 [Melampsora larici-populina 98AG31]EGF99637.1 hypothetical protein MELLADRAFT_94200 [Melampsora larici-populina 98AG31]
MEEDIINPFDLHAINKALVCLELQREWKAISTIDQVHQLGNPFGPHRSLPISHPSSTPPRRSLFTLLSRSSQSSFQSTLRRKKLDRSSSVNSENNSEIFESRNENQIPMLSFLFQKLGYHFPGLSTASSECWDNIQYFFHDFNSRNFSTSQERQELTKRAIISMGYTRILSTYIGSIVCFMDQFPEPARPDHQLMKLVDELYARLPLNDASIRAVYEEKHDTFLVHLPTTSVSYGPIPSSELIRFLRQSYAKDLNITQLNFIDQSLEENISDPNLTSFLETYRLPSLSDEASALINRHQNEAQEEWVRAGQLITQAKQGYRDFIHRLIYEDGELDRTFEMVAQYDSLAALTKEQKLYRNAEFWASLWLASELHFIYVTGPAAEEIRALVIKLDSLMPYELIKQGLKIVNPVLAIKSVVTLLLGQPFGGLSLFQRMVQIVLKNQISTFDKQIEVILEEEEEKETVLAAFEALKDYVYISGREKRGVWDELETKNEDIVMSILSRADDRLTVSQLETISSGRENYYKDLDTVGSRIFRKCSQILRLIISSLTLKRDREHIIEMVLEPNNYIIRTIKIFLDIYYPTIYRVAAVTDLSRRFSDTEAFIKDLIELLKRGSVRVADMIDLLDKHKESYWRFIHEIVGHDDLCKSLKEWFQKILNLIKEGNRSPNFDFNHLESNEPPKLKSLLTEIIESSSTSREEILKEARSIAEYDRCVKAIGELQSRIDILGSQRCDAKIHQDYRSACQELSELDPIIKQRVRVEERKDMLSWAWWVREEEWVGRLGIHQTLNGMESKDDQEIIIDPPVLLVIPNLIEQYVKRVWN